MNVKPRSKFILVSVAVAVALALTGGLLLKTVQAGGWSGPGPMQMAPHGFGTHIKGPPGLGLRICLESWSVTCGQTATSSSTS